MDDRWDGLKLVIAATGGGIAVAIMELLSARSSFPLFVVPFASSIVLVMGAPETAPAQPRALVGGHLLSTLAGLIALTLFGPEPWAAALAVGLAMAAMHVTRTFHPPAGVDPVIVVVYGMPWSFLVAPVGVGAVLLTAFAFVWHNGFQRGTWPVRWL